MENNENYKFFIINPKEDMNADYSFESNCETYNNEIKCYWPEFIVLVEKHGVAIEYFTNTIFKLNKGNFVSINYDGLNSVRIKKSELGLYFNLSKIKLLSDEEIKEFIGTYTFNQKYKRIFTKRLNECFDKSYELNELDESMRAQKHLLLLQNQKGE